MDTLAPWLISLSSNCELGQFRNYVDENRIGIPPMSADDPLLLHLMQGMAMSAKNVGVHVSQKLGIFTQNSIFEYFLSYFGVPS